MRTETLDLEISGRRVRVISESPAASALLRSALADHLVVEPAEAGFVLREPQRQGGLHMLLDRSGFVLGRTRSTEECVAVLGSHLAALVPPPAGTVRIHMRALVGNDSRAVLAGFPLFTTPPLVERRLERASHRIIDRLAVDLAPDGTLEMSPTPWPALAALHTVGGHAPAPVQRLRVAGTLVAQLTRAKPSRANVVSLVAAAVSSRVTRSERIAVAESLARGAVIPVDVNDRSARYAALLS